MRWTLLFLAALVTSPLPTQARWQAGVATTRITPQQPLVMAGYASRTTPGQGCVNELHAKALALHDGSGPPAVLVMLDLLHIPADLGENIAAAAQKETGLPRHRLLLSCTHTHGGPILHIGRHLTPIPTMTPEQRSDTLRYTRDLERTIVDLIKSSLRERHDVRLHLARTAAGFGMNRRQKDPVKGVILGVNPEGPTDPDVPCLFIEHADGRPFAVVFSFACHNTTLGGNIFEFHGDYAGFAQLEVEKQLPGATAMFMSGCCGDINPHPRGTMEMARQHGRELADAVVGAAKKPKKELTGPLASAYELVKLPLAAPPEGEKLQAMLASKEPWLQRRAREIQAIIERDGRVPAEYAYPIQVWKFGSDMNLVALGGEVVVEYVLRLKRELGAERLWVTAYCNDVSFYVPSRKVLEEGGYEPVNSLTYYGFPAGFAPEVEETLIGSVTRILKSMP